MELEMELHNAESSSSAPNRRKRKRNRKSNALCNSNDSCQNCPAAASLMQDIPLERYSCAESKVDISSSSGLHNAESSPSAVKGKRKKRNKKPNALCNSNDTGHDCPGSASSMLAIPQERNPCAESAVDISFNSCLMEAQSDTNLISSGNKKNRKKQQKKRRNASKTVHTDVDSCHDCPDGASLKQDIPQEKNLCVGSTVDISSNSGLIEAQPNSNLMCSQNKRKRKKKQKKQKHNAPQTDNMDVDVQEVASKTMTALFTTESSIDIMKKTASENAPVEVEALGDTSMKMDLAVTPAVKNLSCGQKKRIRRKRHRESLNALKHHVLPINNSLEKNLIPEKDPSLRPLVDVCSKNELVVKQPNGEVCLFNGHNAYESKRVVNLHMPDGKHLENQDVKLAPKVAELDLTIVKEQVSISEKKSSSSGSADGSSMEKHDVHTANGLGLPERRNIITYKRKKEVKTYTRKKNKKDSNSVNGLDCIREDDTRHKSGGSLVKTMSVLHEAHLQKDEDKLDKIQIVKQDASHWGHVSDEIPSDPKEDNISGHDARCEHPKKNVEAETKMAEIFPSSHLGVIKVDVVSDNTSREENLPQTLQSSPERVCIGLAKKKLLVLDVNGLLADIVQDHNLRFKPDIMVSNKAVYKRPYCNNFLRFCFERFNVGVWSSRIKKNVNKVIDYLMGDSRQNLFFCWDASHCSQTGLNTIDNNRKPLVLKELKKLWEKLEPDLPWEKGEYDATNTLLLDDSPYKALCNPEHTAIFPYSYDYRNRRDFSLGPGGDLRVYLERLADAENVQEYVREHPFGQRPITESHRSWGFYSKVFHTKPCPPHLTG